MMNIIRIFAALLCLAILLSFAGCHKKDEIAYTVGDVEFTSGMYACALFWADNDAKSLVYSEMSTEDQQKEVDWAKQTIEGVKYDEYVKSKAIEKLNTFATIITEAKKANVTLDDESKTMANSYANYYWNSYGYGAVLSLNGVAYETYVKYMEYEYLYDTYFLHIYGEEGEKALSEDALKEELAKNYALYNKITISLQNSEGKALSDSEIETLKKTAEDYVSRLNKGETFAEIYDEHNQKNKEDNSSSNASSTDSSKDSSVEENTSSGNTSSKEPYSEPADEHAQLVSGLDTSSFYNEEIWGQIKDMENGVAKSYTAADNSSVNVLVKKDVLEDPYWLKSTRDVVTYSLKEDEYVAALKAVTDTLAKKENSFAIGQFKASKITYGE